MSQYFILTLTVLVSSHVSVNSAGILSKSSKQIWHNDMRSYHKKVAKLPGIGFMSTTQWPAEHSRYTYVILKPGEEVPGKRKNLQSTETPNPGDSPIVSKENSTCPTALVNQTKYKKVENNRFMLPANTEGANENKACVTNEKENEISEAIQYTSERENIEAQNEVNLCSTTETNMQFQYEIITQNELAMHTAFEGDINDKNEMAAIDRDIENTQKAITCIDMKNQNVMDETAPSICYSPTEKTIEFQNGMATTGRDNTNTQNEIAYITEEDLSCLKGVVTTISEDNENTQNKLMYTIGADPRLQNGMATTISGDNENQNEISYLTEKDMKFWNGIVPMTSTDNENPENEMSYTTEKDNTFSKGTATTGKDNDNPQSEMPYTTEKDNAFLKGTATTRKDGDNPQSEMPCTNEKDIAFSKGTASTGKDDENPLGEMTYTTEKDIAFSKGTASTGKDNENPQSEMPCTTEKNINFSKGRSTTGKDNENPQSEMSYTTEKDIKYTKGRIITGKNKENIVCECCMSTTSKDIKCYKSVTTRGRDKENTSSDIMGTTDKYTKHRIATTTTSTKDKTTKKNRHKTKWRSTTEKNVKFRKIKTSTDKKVIKYVIEIVRNANESKIETDSDELKPINISNSTKQYQNKIRHYPKFQKITNEENNLSKSIPMKEDNTNNSDKGKRIGSSKKNPNKAQYMKNSPHISKMIKKIVPKEKN